MRTTLTMISLNIEIFIIYTYHKAIRLEHDYTLSLSPYYLIRFEFFQKRFILISRKS